METGATPPVDIYPWLHWLPQSIFSNWVDRATRVQNGVNHLYSDLLRDIRVRRAKAGSRGSFMDTVLDQAEGEKRMDGLTYSDHELWFMGGTLSEVGSDTTAAVITIFVHAMTTYPEVQKKAQAQIDTVVGEDRSPQWQDYCQLPYVAQCVKEIIRWRPVTLLAFPHALAQDDWVDGKLLPKGTVVIINAWGLQHDPERFSNPEVFDPDHFAGNTTLATELAKGPYEKRDHYGYGSGRRFCPGAHLAERSLFVTMAKLLWAFDIRPGNDDAGNAIEPDVDPSTGHREGFLVCAKDFAADIKVRGEWRKATILKEYEEAGKDVFAKYEASGEEVA